MKNLLIHIGLHKTGTTWMQNELFVSDSEYFIPLSNGESISGHSSLATKFYLDNSNDILNSFDDNSKVIHEELEKLTVDYRETNKIFVMSHERLSGYPSSAGFDASIICQRIKKIFPQAKILIIIREQVSCILSNYFQYLNEGGVLSIEQYLKKRYDERTPVFSENYFKYHYMINYYQTEFQKQNVLVLPYELFQRDKMVFFDKLSQFLNIEIKIDPEKFRKQYNLKSNHYINYHFRFLNNYINSSSSLNGANGLRFHKSKKFSKKLKRFLSYFGSDMKDKAIQAKLMKVVQEWSKGKFIESNKISSELIGEDLTNYGYE